VGNFPRFPYAPEGASSLAQTGLDAPPLLARWAGYYGGFRLSPDPIVYRQIDHLLSTEGTEDPTTQPFQATGGAGLIAYTVEFVAKPQEAQRVQSALPRTLTGVLRGATGFAGCLVMASRQEARLITVVTLWTGKDAQKWCAQSARRIERLLAPYVDHRLRVQTLVAALAARLLTGTGTRTQEGCSSLQSLCPDVEEVCLA
jgi:hypothetical protein